VTAGIAPVPSAMAPAPAALSGAAVTGLAPEPRVAGPASNSVARPMADAARPMMGGRVSIHIRAAAERASLVRHAERALDRLAAWALPLSRFEPASELSRLNAAPGRAVPIGPTLTAVLDWARTAEAMTDGLVDVAMLDARLAAEAGDAVRPPVVAGRRWSLVRSARAAAVLREPGVRLDIDGVAKGWLADRTLALLLRDVPDATVLVDGDGDVAASLVPGDELLVGVADPRTDDGTLAIVRLAAADGDPARRFGLATSGTSVHRWARGATVTHHLIDPATWRPAETDVVQATVLAGTARAAEAWAKAAVLLGVDRAPSLLDRPDVLGLLLLTSRGEIRATPGMLPWLA
jgi:FAD:protein FMN transferase